MTKTIFGKVNTILFEDKKMIIELENKTKYYSKVVKGSVQCKIYNDLNKIVPLNLLEEGSIIKVKAIEDKIKEIYINSKYDFVSDSSDEYLTE